MNWFWALIIVIAGNAALFIGLAMLIRVANGGGRRR